MGRKAGIVLYVLALVSVRGRRGRLVLQHRSGSALMVNVGIVVVFAAFYLRFP